MKNKTDISSAPATQDGRKEIKGTKTKMATPQVVVRPIDRSPKDISDWRGAHIAAESIYYPNFTRLNDIYETVTLDLFLSGIIRKRISQVVNKRLLFMRNGEACPDMAKVIKKKVFKDIMRQILQTKFWGINGLEFVPGEKMKFNLIPKKHIKRKTQLIAYEQSGLNEGIDYTDIKNIWILGDEGDLGLLLMCGFIVLLKKGVISDWAQYIEIFGSPAIVLKYKGYDQQAKVAADKILSNIGGSMKITIPEEMGLTFEDGKISNGDGKLQDAARRAFNEELSIGILGNTETTGHSGTGTGAKSKTHSEQQLEIIKDDMDDLCDALNSDHFMEILKSYGYDVEGGEFEFDREVDIAYIQEKYIVDVALITQVGLKVSKKYLYETYGIPEPKPGEDCIELDPTLGQQPTTIDPDTEDGKPVAKPKPKKKPVTAQLGDQAPVTLADVKALLTDFFGPAL